VRDKYQHAPKQRETLGPAPMAARVAQKGVSQPSRKRQRSATPDAQELPTKRLATEEASSEEYRRSHEHRNSRSPDRQACRPPGGSSSSQLFWDPVWILERQLVHVLRTHEHMALTELLTKVDWVPGLGRCSTGAHAFAVEPS
jgi:hypothetical protein